MKTTVHPTNLVPRSPLFARTARVLAVVALIAPIMTLAACKDSAAPVTTSPTDTIIATGPPSADTPTLVGTWRGSMAGSSGSSGITIVLRADSTLQGTISNAINCNAGTDVWTVSGIEHPAIQFAVTGGDCKVTSFFRAPVESGDASRRLTGFWWSANTGGGGTFTLEKQ